MARESLVNLVWWALALLACVALCRFIAADARKLDSEPWYSTRRSAR